MTIDAEVSNNVEPVAETQVSEPAESDQSAPEPASDEAPKEATPVAEKMIPQSQVNKIAAREARHATEKTRNAMLAEFQAQQQQAQQAPQQQSRSLGGIEQMSDEQFQQKIYEAAFKMSTQQQANKMAADFEQTMKSVLDNDQDFADRYEELNIAQYPQLVMWTDGLANRGEVIKEIVMNPEKFAQVLMLANSGAPGLAKESLRKISSSIKANVDAQKQPTTKQPLDQLKPSSIGIDDSAKSVSDFRAMFRG